MLRASSLRTSWLIRDLPEGTSSIASGIPFWPALELRLAQAWHLGNVEGYRWVPKGKRIEFVEWLCELSKDENRKTPQYAINEATCIEAWDAHFGTLYHLLCTWRAAGQDYAKWWNCPANLTLRVALQKAHRQILTDGPLPIIGTINIFVSAQESIVEVAKILAYRVFGVILNGQQKYAFCDSCDAVFIPSARRYRYHTRACGCRDTSRRAKIRKALRRNYRRILVASRYLILWRQDPAGLSSRQMVKDALSDRDLIDVSLITSKSKWYEQYVKAALDGPGSSTRAALFRSIVRQVEEILDAEAYKKVVHRITRKLDRLYLEILETHAIESRAASQTRPEPSAPRPR